MVTPLFLCIVRTENDQMDTEKMKIQGGTRKDRDKKKKGGKKQIWKGR